MAKAKGNTVQMPEAWAAQFTAAEKPVVDSLQGVVGASRNAAEALRKMLETHSVDSPEGTARRAALAVKLATFDGEKVPQRKLREGSEAMQHAARLISALSSAAMELRNKAKGPGEEKSDAQRAYDKAYPEELRLKKAENFNVELAAAWQEVVRVALKHGAKAKTKKPKAK